ncbi:MAG TPA: asparagine synthase (glutamine-hydrolyzing) [Acidimicrobiales bacterium]|nr:asparagine synthase (glutamine-hydrolyzing) [Acidimicrobiales bacterium]
MGVGGRGHYCPRATQELLKHRGPDGAGTVFWQRGHQHVSLDRSATPPDVILVHTRLAILDCTPAGHQPMVSDDKTLAIAYNGELYNYLELRDVLRRLGHGFRSSGDTEVVLKAWMQWGLDCVTRFQGMFAIAALDLRRNELALVRDEYGIKPLYYRRHVSGFHFASEIRPLLDGSERGSSSVATRYLVGGGVPDGTSETFFEGVEAVRRGTVVRIDLASLRSSVTEWAPAVRRLTSHDISWDSAVGQVQDQFERSVDKHLRSDVPVACALSGGIDSSALISVARKVRGKHERITAISYIPDDIQISEESWMALVARTAECSWIRVTIPMEDVASEMDDLILSQGEPFASSSVFAQRRIYEAARLNGFSVVLDGQGADELLGGYPFFVLKLIRDLIRTRRLSAAWRVAGSGTLRSSALTSVGREIARTILPGRLSSLASASALAMSAPMVIGFMDTYRVETATTGRAVSLEQSLASELLSAGLGGLLRYQDRNSMAYSVESRVPFLGTEFARLIRSLPTEYLIDETGTTKAIFRAAMRGLVPDEILDRRDKVGFVTPQQGWLKHVIHGVIGSEWDIPFLDRRAVERHFRSLSTSLEGGRGLSWRLFNLIRWSQLSGVRWEAATP